MSTGATAMPWFPVSFRRLIGFTAFDGVCGEVPLFSPSESGLQWQRAQVEIYKNLHVWFDQVSPTVPHCEH